jgi:hypothetical protein
LPVKQVDDEYHHDRTPLFDRSHPTKFWFQTGFVPTGKWFRRQIVLAVFWPSSGIDMAAYGVRLIGSA